MNTAKNISYDSLLRQSKKVAKEIGVPVSEVTGELVKAYRNLGVNIVHAEKKKHKK